MLRAKTIRETKNTSKNSVKKSNKGKKNVPKQQKFTDFKKRSEKGFKSLIATDSSIAKKNVLKKNVTKTERYNRLPDI